MALRSRILTWLPSVAGILVCLAAFALAHWQLGRAEQKRALQARWDAGAQQQTIRLEQLPPEGGDWLYRRIRLTGEFAAGHQVYLDNRLHQGRAGYHVIAPLRLERGGVVLVNRGWLAGDPDRRNTPYARVVPGKQVLEGILLRARSRYFELGANTVQGTVWQNLDLERYRGFYARNLPDWLLLQTNESGDGLVRAWPRPDTGVDKHISYAGQWYALSVTSLVLTLIHLWRRYRGHKSRSA